MALILDHVNGVHDDNRLENLRIVCAELQRDARHALWTATRPASTASAPAHCGAAVFRPTAGAASPLLLPRVRPTGARSAAAAPGGAAASSGRRTTSSSHEIDALGYTRRRAGDTA